MEYKKIYVLYERNTDENGNEWYKEGRLNQLDIAVSDDWAKLNNLRLSRLDELRTCAERAGKLKSTDLCDRVYTINYKGKGAKTELFIDTHYLV